MPELPELTVLASQMRRELTGKLISRAQCLQPKCSNAEPGQLDVTLSGRRVGETTSKGKWLFMPAEPGYSLLINLGMGLTWFGSRPAIRCRLSTSSGWT